MQLFCGQCGALVDNNEDLSEHVRADHTQEYTVYYVCYVCGVSADTKEAAKVHQEKHTEEEIQECFSNKRRVKPVSPGMASFC